VNHRRWALFLLIAAIAPSIPMAAAAAKPSVVVENVNGAADIATVDDDVIAVTTGADARVIAKVDALHDVTVYQNTQLQFGTPTRLQTGTMRVRGTLTIATATARSTVRDSEMTVAYDEQSGITTIEVADHEAVVRGTNDEREQHVAAGEMVRVGPDGITSVPRAISDDELFAARIAPPVTASKGTSARYLVAAVAGVCLVAALASARRARRNATMT
jgi:hypothetical protein